MSDRLVFWCVSSSYRVPSPNRKIALWRRPLFRSTMQYKRMRGGRGLNWIPPPSLVHTVLKKRLSSSLSATKHSKPLERAEGFFLCENGGSENSAWGKQAVESILKAPPPPPHPPSTPLSRCRYCWNVFHQKGAIYLAPAPAWVCVCKWKREK